MKAMGRVFAGFVYGGMYQGKIRKKYCNSMQIKNKPGAKVEMDLKNQCF